MAIENKKQNRVLLIGILLIALVVTISFFRSKSEKKDNEIKSVQETKNYPKITAEELKQKIESDKNLQILDIRSSDEYQFEHIINSKNANSVESLSSFDPEKMTVIIGNYAETENSDKAFETLRDKKFKSSFILSGGFSAWKNSGGNTISIGNPGSFVDQSKAAYTTPEDLKKIVEDANYQKYVLDVRSAESFSKEHLPQAQNIPLDDLEKSTEKIPFGKEIFVYGENDTQGFQGATRLFDLNFFGTKILKGGIADWKAKGFPIEK